MRWRVCVAGLVVAFVLGTGCNRLTGLMNPGSAETGPVPATEDECRTFAADLEHAVTTQDQARTADLLHFQGVFYASMSDFDGPPEFHARLRQTCKDKAASDPFVPLMLAAVRRGAQFHLLRVHAVDGRHRALFRFIGADGCVDYLDVIPARHPDGKVRMEDFFGPDSGELATQTIRRVILKVAAEENQGPPGHAVSQDRVWVTTAPRRHALHEAMIAGRSPEAVAIYKQLPAEVRTDKSVFLKYVIAAYWTGPAEYLRALEGYRKQFPNDPAVRFQDIDYFRLTRQHEANLKAIAAVEKAIGGDPYLHCLRAMTFVRARRFSEARAAAEKAVAQEPTLKYAYQSRLRVALEEGNHTDTLAWLKKVFEKTGERVGDLRADPDYAAFVQSREYRDWLTWVARTKDD